MFKGAAQNDKSDTKSKAAYLLYTVTIFGVLLFTLIYIGNRISSVVLEEKRVENGFFIAKMPTPEPKTPKQKQVKPKVESVASVKTKTKSVGRQQKREKRPVAKPAAVKPVSKPTPVVTDKIVPPSPNLSTPQSTPVASAKGEGGVGIDAGNGGDDFEQTIDVYREVRWVQVTVKHKFRPEISGVNSTLSFDGCRAQFWIDSRGVPRKVKLLKCRGHHDNRVASALKKWRFHPVKGPGGKPTPVTFKLPIGF